MADIHHHHEADHLGRAIEITEGIAHRRMAKDPRQEAQANFYSDIASVELEEFLASKIRYLRSMPTLVLTQSLYFSATSPSGNAFANS